MSTVDEMENASETVLVCPRCDMPNARGRKFCAQCGAPLWETCLQCGEVCTVGENFCGGCGVNLNEAAAEQLEQLDAAFREATEQQAAGRYEEAQTVLQNIAKKDHPRLAERADRARRLGHQWITQRRRAQATAQEALQEARRLFDAADYEAAARRLAGVPVSLRVEDILALQAEIDLRQQQVVALEKELQQAIREKRLLDLPAAIERLLTLKPDHAHTKKLAEQLRNHLTAAAERRLARHDYDGSLQLLDAIVPLGASPRSDALRGNVAELACLAWDLRNAPTVDPALASAAERLRRSVPGDAASIKRCDELRQRMAAPADPQRLEPIAWADLPRETPLGLPVDWSIGWRRFTRGAALDSADLQRHPGRFQTACGLALAGLRKSPLRIDLLSAEPRGMVSRVAGMVRAAAPRAAWGIDLGASALKAVRLTWDANRQLPAVETAVVLEYAKPLGQAFNEIEETRLISETIEAFLRGHSLKGDEVCVGVPGRMAMSRSMDLPPVASHKARSLVEFETRLEIDMPLSQLLWDWGPLGAFADRNGEAKPQTRTQNGCRALWVAVKRHAADRYLSMFRRLKLRVDVLQPDFIALHNFLSHEFFFTDGGESAPTRPTVAALDIGCDTTNIVVSSPDSLWFHSCGLAGHSFTRALVKEFNWSMTQAEQQKRAPESAERLSDFHTPFAPLFADFLKEVQQSLAAYATVQPDHPVDRVLGLGGGFALHGLFRHLRCGR